MQNVIMYGAVISSAKEEASFYLPTCPQIPLPVLAGEECACMCVWGGLLFPIAPARKSCRCVLYLSHRHSLDGSSQSTSSHIRTRKVPLLFPPRGFTVRALQEQRLYSKGRGVCVN